MNATEAAGRLRREVSGRDAVLCPGPGRSPKVIMKRDPTRPDCCPVHGHNRHRRSAATGRQAVANGVCLHHEQYPTS
jgi:hypothetical protein